MFRNLFLKPIYNSEYEDISDSFYNPIMKNAVTFDRISAYFSAHALALYSEGLEYFGRNGYKYRLIISKDVSEDDYEEIKSGYLIKKGISEEMIISLQQELSLSEERKISNLAYLISIGIVDIKIAFKKTGIFHDKCGLVSDLNGDRICFRGSNNETEAAIIKNYEAFQVICSWLDCNGFYNEGILESQKEFERLWNNQVPRIVVLPAENVIINEIVRYNKGELIVEDVLLKENAIILDYNNVLQLHVNTEKIDWLINNAIYKIRLKRHVDKITGNTIFFKKSLSYLEFIKINDLLNQKIPEWEIEYYSTRRLYEYIEEKNYLIEKRAKLGIELKTDAKRLDGKFIEFSDIVNMGMSRKLREKQMMDAFFLYAMSKAGNFSVPGSGKTSSVLGVYRFLKEKNILDRILMIGPKNAFGSWIDEFNVCFKGIEEIKCFNIQDSQYKKIKEKKHALRFDTGACNLFLFNYECLGTYEKELIDIVKKRTLLVFDEVHKVKRIDGEYAKHTLHVAEQANHIIAMTGTPIPNTYQDLYNFLHILFNNEYEEFFGFDVSTLKNPSSDEVEKINGKIQPFFCRTTKQELLVPEANKDVIYMVYRTQEEQQIFDIIRKKYRKNKFSLFIRVLQLESNPSMLLETLDISEFSNVLDITDNIDDIDIVDYSMEIKNLICSIDITTKKKKCIELTKNLVLEGKSIIIWCIFKDSIRSIAELLNDIGISAKCIYGEVPLEDRFTLVNDYRNGEFDVLITNPHTLAESVSLHSICHDAIYFEYSYNLVHLLQSKDRIHRLGLKDGQYTQYYYLQNKFIVEDYEYSMDEVIYIRLKEKEKIMLDAIDNHKLEKIYTTDEDLELIFNKL